MDTNFPEQNWVARMAMSWPNWGGHKLVTSSEDNCSGLLSWTQTSLDRAGLPKWPCHGQTEVVTNWSHLLRTTAQGCFHGHKLPWTELGCQNGHVMTKLRWSQTGHIFWGPLLRVALMDTNFPGQSWAARMAMSWLNWGGHKLVTSSEDHCSGLLSWPQTSLDRAALPEWPCCSLTEVVTNWSHLLRTTTQGCFHGYKLPWTELGYQNSHDMAKLRWSQTGHIFWGKTTQGCFHGHKLPGSNNPPGTERNQLQHYNNDPPGTSCNTTIMILQEPVATLQ